VPKTDQSGQKPLPDRPLELHRHFGPALPRLGWVPAPRYILRRARLLKLLSDVSPQARVLDVGCGAATFLFELHQRGLLCEGLETSELAAEIAREVHAETQVPIHRGPGEWSHRFDLVTAFEVLEHIKDDLGALTSWRNWIKPDGQLWVSVPAHPENWDSSDIWAGHVRRYTREQLLERLQDAGFRVENIECYGFPLSNVVEMVRARHLNTGDDDMAARTKLSGVDRKFETRVWPLLRSWPVALAIRGFCVLQNRFLQRDWGTGYIAVARNQLKQSK
jgi:SAM-dependent methyltransferase